MINIPKKLRFWGGIRYIGKKKKKKKKKKTHRLWVTVTNYSCRFLILFYLCLLELPCRWRFNQVYIHKTYAVQSVKNYPSLSLMTSHLMLRRKKQSSKILSPAFDFFKVHDPTGENTHAHHQIHDKNTCKVLEKSAQNCKRSCAHKVPTTYTLS